MMTALRKKVGKVPKRAKKGGEFGASLRENTLIFGRAPLLSTMTVNAYVNAIGQKPGPFLGHLSQSRSKFLRGRSTPTPIYVAHPWNLALPFLARVYSSICRVCLTEKATFERSGVRKKWYFRKIKFLLL